MRRSIAVPWLVAAFLAASAFAVAAQEDDEASPAPPLQEELEPAQIDDLFKKLGSEANSAGAQRIAQRIWNIWNDSGSQTVDLLMQWSARAIGEKDYALAEDLLTQVKSLRPDYAEGWNRSATLHYMRSDFGRSLSDIERTLRLEPRHFGALSGLAAILQKTDQDRRALQVWYRVLAIYPANEGAQKAVIELEEKLAGKGA